MKEIGEILARSGLRVFRDPCCLIRRNGLLEPCCCSLLTTSSPGRLCVLQFPKFISECDYYDRDRIYATILTLRASRADPDILSCAGHLGTSSSLPFPATQHTYTRLCFAQKFAQTCHAAHRLVYESKDQWLWRELFLAHPFDDIRNALLLGREPPKDIDWKNELQSRIEAQLVSQSFSPLMLLGPKVSFDRVLETFVWALETATPVTLQDTHEHIASDNLQWVENVLRNSLFLFADALWSSESSKQLQSRLRAHFYLCYEETPTEEMRKRMNAARRMSRCYVYDLRKYTETTLWGPYCPASEPEDVTVDWTHIEHIVDIVAMKLRELPPIARRIFKPPFYGLGATRAFSAPLSFRRLPWDWAGVTGVWRRMVCFMDYRYAETVRFYSNVN